MSGRTAPRPTTSAVRWHLPPLRATRPAASRPRPRRRRRRSARARARTQQHCVCVDVDELQRGRVAAGGVDRERRRCGDVDLAGQRRAEPPRRRRPRSSGPPPPPRLQPAGPQRSPTTSSPARAAALAGRIVPAPRVRMTRSPSLLGYCAHSLSCLAINERPADQWSPPVRQNRRRAPPRPSPSPSGCGAAEPVLGALLGPSDSLRARPTLGPRRQPRTSTRSRAAKLGLCFSDRSIRSSELVVGRVSAQRTWHICLRDTLTVAPRGAVAK